MVDETLERFLKSWIDGELGPDEAAEVAAYLNGNPAAQARVSDYRKVAAVIRKVAGNTPLPMPRPDVIRRRAVRREQEERQVIQWLQRLTAAAAVLFVTTLGLLFVSSPAAGVSEIVADRTSAPASYEGAEESDEVALLDQAMILALNDPSWEMPFR